MAFSNATMSCLINSTCSNEIGSEPRLTPALLHESEAMVSRMKTRRPSSWGQRSMRLRTETVGVGFGVGFR